MKKNIILLVLGLLSGVFLCLLFDRGCNTVGVVNHQGVVTYDSTPFVIYRDSLIPFETKIKGDRYDSLIHDTVWLSENNDSIIQDWIVERIYIDTLKNDTNAFIRIVSVVRMNNLDDMELEFKNRRKTQIINTYESTKKGAQLYMGGYFNRTHSGLFGFGAKGGVLYHNFLFGCGGGSDGVNVFVLKKL